MLATCDPHMPVNFSSWSFIVFGLPNIYLCRPFDAVFAIERLHKHVNFVMMCDHKMKCIGWYRMCAQNDPKTLGRDHAPAVFVCEMYAMPIEVNSDFTKSFFALWTALKRYKSVTNTQTKGTRKTAMADCVSSRLFKCSFVAIFQLYTFSILNVSV